jgi:uncharacterized protein (DUF302 family)
MATNVLGYTSAFDVATTIDRLAELAAAKGMTIFARIDFSADAKAAGLALRPEQLLIFGNPKGGTPLLQSSPSAGLDLPLKALAYEDSDGVTRILLNDPAYIIARHGVAPELEKNIAGAAALVASAAGASNV